MRDLRPVCGNGRVRCGILFAFIGDSLLELCVGHLPGSSWLIELRELRGRQVLGCFSDCVHKLLGGLLPRFDWLDSMLIVYSGLLLQFYRSYDRDGCLRGWLLFGRVCYCVCELRGRHLRSCVVVVIMYELRGEHLPKFLRLTFVHCVYRRLLLCHVRTVGCFWGVSVG